MQRCLMIIIDTHIHRSKQINEKYHIENRLSIFFSTTPSYHLFYYYDTHIHAIIYRYNINEYWLL